MLKNDVFSLDLGTTKFCIAALMREASGARSQIKTTHIPAQGMHRGMIANIELASSALSLLIDKAENDFKIDIRRVVVGVAGSQLSCKKSSGKVYLSNKCVNISDIQNLTKHIETEFSSAGRYILHAIPLEFRVDEREYVQNPLGLFGTTLSGKYLIIEGDESYLKDVIRVCNKSGLEVIKIYAEPVASASVTVSEEQKNLGVAVADIGGGTTDGIVFQNGKPYDLFTINIAGVLITKDLAIGLNTPIHEAEKIKTFYGLSCGIFDDFIYNDLEGCKKIPKHDDIYNIIGSRVYELLELLVYQLKPYKGRLGSGLLFTGGGSEIKELCEFTQKLVKLPVHKIDPHLNIPYLADQKFHFASKFATVIGLLNLEIGRQISDNSFRKQFMTRYYLGQFINWIKELS